MEMQSEVCVVFEQCWVGDGMGRWISAKVLCYRLHVVVCFE